MRLFSQCASGKMHYPKHYRHYYDDKEFARCKCGDRWIDKDFWKDDEQNKPIIGEKCKRCDIVYRHPKLWYEKCSECQPKGGK